MHKFSITIIFFTLYFYSCKEEMKNEDINKLKSIEINWTDEQKRIYFQDSIAYRMYNGKLGMGDSINNFEIFSRIMLSDIKAKNKDEPLIFALEEPYIDTTKINNDKYWFRVVVEPTFSKAFCLIVEKKYKRTYVTLKLTDGYGSYYTGLLNFSITKVYPDTLYTNISKVLHKVNFWNLGKDTLNVHGIDGENWTFEAIENGKYNIIKRWCPEAYGNRITRELGNYVIEILKKTDLWDLVFEEKKKD